MFKKECRIKRAQSLALAYLQRGLTLQEAFLTLYREHFALVYDLPVGPVWKPVKKQAGLV